MIGFRTTALERLRRRLREEETFLAFFQAFDLESEQEDYGMRRGFDFGRQFKRQTAKRRAARTGYYRRSPRRGASANRPFGVWTGRFLKSTFGAGSGRKRARVGVLTFQAIENRPVRHPWDLVTLDGKIGSAYAEWLQRALDLQRPFRRVRIGGYAP